MGAIDNFLRRFGYAKLDRYGLILTPDDRVISMRPAVLDDGLGAKIVGWSEGDLAAMELEHWGAPKRATAKPIAAPASLHKLPPAPPPLAARVVAPATPIAPVAAPVSRPLPGVAPAPVAVIAPTPIPAPAPAPAPVVAAAEEPGEDEWEWEIAMARARAVETEVARVDLVRASAVVASAINGKTNPGFPINAKTQPGKHEPEPLPPWPETEPFNEAWVEENEVAPQVMSVMQKKLAVARSTPARGAAAVKPPVVTFAPEKTVQQPSPFATEKTRPLIEPMRSTVIPVPQLPTVTDPKLVRPAAYTPSQPKARAARGTGNTGKIDEHTVRTNAAPANDDRTSPYITVPDEVKPSGFAHTKRVAAKQR